MISKSILFPLFLGVGVGVYADDPNSIAIFPDANSRETYFSYHNIRSAQKLSKGRGCKVGILDHSFGTKVHPEMYAGGKNFVEDSDEFLTTKEWHGYWMALALYSVAPEAAIFALNTRSFKNPAGHAVAISKAIDWAIEHKLDVLTFSHEAIRGENKAILNSALDRAHSAGIITTFIHTGHPTNIMPSGLWGGTDDGREPDINVFHYDYSVIHVPEYFKLKNKEKSW